MSAPTLTFLDLMHLPAQKPQTVVTEITAPAIDAWQAAVDASLTPHDANMTALRANAAQRQREAREQVERKQWEPAAIEPTLPRSPEFLAAQAERAERIAEHDRHNYRVESAAFERMQKEQRDGK